MSSTQHATICSLDELQVHLTDEVRLCLASQYEALYNNDEAAASRHMDRVLRSMKTAPSTSTCRVNQILATRQEVMEGLREVLTLWKTRHSHPASAEQDESDCIVVTEHPVLSDVVCVGSVDATAATLADKGLSKCRVPRTSTSEQQHAIFANWQKRAEKGWPLTHRVVICDRFCGEAVLRGSDIFVRGVLCADLGIQPGADVAVYADLPVKDGSRSSVLRGLLLEKYNGRCIFLGLGRACCTRADFFNSSKGVAVEMSAKASDRAGPTLPPLHGVMPGKFMLQNLPSTVVAHALSPQAGEIILDMCSAPGGKASHVASLICNNATIIACDKSHKKMVSAKEMFRSMGGTCITPLALDSTSCVIRDGTAWRSATEVLSLATASEKDGLLNVGAFYPESFDRIVLDPPCSALGLRPKLLVDAETLTDLKKYVKYQRLFVREAVSLLKPGGTMTYSTCTINASENELMVRHILDEYSTMELVPIEMKLGLPGLPGMGLNETERSHVRRFDPSDATADTMGFFVAKFVKART